MRLPRRDSRCTLRPEEENSIEAVPLYAAKWPGSREPGDVTGVTDDQRGNDRTDPEDLGQCRARRRDSFGDACLGALQLRVEHADLVECFVGELETLTLCRGHGLDRREDLFCLSDNDFLADAARDEFTHQSVQTLA